MAKKTAYVHNSQPKDFIRNKWIEFAKETYHGANHEFGILTFPAEAMQDLHLFQEKGFIEWEEAETDSDDGTPNYRITKGNVRCFEKKTAVYALLNKKLSQAKVSQDDFCAYVEAQYSKIMGGKDKTFPVDVVNLDFEARLYPSTKYPLENTIKRIFEFQKKHERSFSLFLTWPVVEEEDITEFKSLLQSVINNNLRDPSAVSFKDSFEETIGTIDNLHYERKSVIGVTKVVLKKASQNLYALAKSEFYVYGGGERQRMLSLLFNFKYDGTDGTENIIYAQDVVKAMDNLIDISDHNL